MSFRCSGGEVSPLALSAAVGAKAGAVRGEFERLAVVALGDEGEISLLQIDAGGQLGCIARLLSLLRTRQSFRCLQALSASLLVRPTTRAR